MTNNEIISYLKENRIRHTVFTSMPEDVKEWCEVNVYEITIPFRKMTTDGWIRMNYDEPFDYESVYCLDGDCEAKPVEHTTTKTISAFAAVNLFRKLRLLLEAVGFTRVSISEVREDKKLDIWFQSYDVRELNSFLWAGCHRYFNLGGNTLFSVHIDHCDPDRDSKGIELVMSSNENFTEDKLIELEEFVKGLEVYVENYLNKE